jgi:hypothetical protein
MNLNAAHGGPESRQDWLTNALNGTDGRALERYLQSVVEKIEAGELNEALTLSAALPEICSMLEHPQLRTSPAHCICWCDAWVALDGDDESQNVFPLTRIYLREEGDDAAEWITADASFARSVSGSLLDAARNWYRQRGAFDLTVQQNLGKMSAWSAF